MASTIDHMPIDRNAAFRGNRVISTAVIRRSIQMEWPARHLSQRRDVQCIGHDVQHVGGRMKLSMLLWLATVLPQPVADQTCLATTIYLEARSESIVGQMAVAEVALRRRERGQWGNTVCAVVNAPHQFANSTLPRSLDIDNLAAFQKAWAIAGKSISNWTLPLDERHLFVPRASYFATAQALPRGAHVQTVNTIGDHVFYKIN